MLRNLRAGVILETTHPEIPTCEECAKWAYDADWKKSLRGGQPYARYGDTPCMNCPKGRPDNKPHPEKELLRVNRQALSYYFMCQQDQTGLLPRDLLTVQNNAVIAQALADVDRGRMDMRPLFMAAMMARR